jgi:hypothetical protein
VFSEHGCEHTWDNATKFGLCPWKPSTLALSGTPHNGNPIGQCRAPIPVEHLLRARAHKTLLCALESLSRGGGLARILRLGADAGRWRNSAAMRAVLCILCYGLGCRSGS